MKKKHLSIAVSLLLTVVFLFLAVRNVEMDALGDVLARARGRWLAGMVVIILLDLVIRAARWGLLLPKTVARPFWLLLRLETIGLAVNNVLFLRLGEISRAVLAGRELGVPVATALSSVVVERAHDVIALLSLFNVSAALLPSLIPPEARLAALMTWAAAVTALLALVLAERTLKPGGAWERRLRSWPKIHEMASQLTAGAQVLRSPAAAFSAFFLSLALWLMDAGVYWFAAFALELDHLIDYPRAILVLSYGGAGSALPAAPGAIGTFEAVVKSIVERLGATPHEAFGYAVFCHMATYTVVTSIGMIFLYRVGLSFSGLKAEVAKK